MNRLQRLVKGKRSEPAKVAQEILSVAKANLKRKNSELEALRRKKGEEPLKTRPSNRRLEYFDDEIELIKKETEDLLYKIEALEDQFMGIQSRGARKKGPV